MQKQTMFHAARATTLLLLVFLAYGHSAQAQYSITFYAKISSSDLGESGWIGHVWVGLGNGIQSTVRGFYPDGLKDDASRSPDIYYSFSITEAKYKEGISVIDIYEHKKYILGLNDCRGFASAVAAAVGLRVPGAGAKSPAEWMADLIDNN